MEPEDIVPLLSDLMYRCGGYSKDRLEGEKKVETKTTSADVVTEVDLRVQYRIEDWIGKNFPGHRVLSEETTAERKISVPASSLATEDQLEDYDYLWIIDPIDGTTNYSHGLGIYSISAALYRSGECVLGMIHAPGTGELFHALKGGGVFLDEKRVRCSEIRDMSKALAVSGYPYDPEDMDPTRTLMSGMSKHVQELRALGSAALELAYVASGKLDLYFEYGLKPWDTAAGRLMVKEGGGGITDMRGSEYDIFSPQILASNGTLHRDAVELIRKILNPGE